MGTIYTGKSETLDIKFSRVWAMPSPWTFTIRPVSDLLTRYGTKRLFAGCWVDPYAGRNSPAGYWTNDIDPSARATFHLDALEFSKLCKDGQFDGILYDPPYSYRQISEHYKSLGLKATKLTTSSAFYEKVKSAFCEKIKPNGIAISFGWNTNGFGKARGFRIVEIMCVAHGGSKNDTIVTVEKKI